VENVSQSFKRDIAQTKQREATIKRLMGQVAYRLGSRFPSNYSPRSDGGLPLFVFDDQKDVNTAKQLKDEVEQMLREKLVEAGWTAAEARRMKVHFISKQEPAPPKS
jgi:hypothetical protein